MSDETRVHLIAYDIPDDRRRTRVSKLLESYGDRVQYSVFMISARPARIIRLSDELAILIDASADSILICNLGRRSGSSFSAVQTIGRTRPITPDDILSL